MRLLVVVLLSFPPSSALWYIYFIDGASVDGNFYCGIHFSERSVDYSLGPPSFKGRLEVAVSVNETSKSSFALTADSNVSVALHTGLLVLSLIYRDALDFTFSVNVSSDRAVVDTSGNSECTPGGASSPICTPAAACDKKKSAFCICPAFSLDFASCPGFVLPNTTTWNPPSSSSTLPDSNSTSTTPYPNSTVIPTQTPSISYPDAHPGLKNLTHTAITNETVHIVLNQSLIYSKMGTLLNPDDVTILSVLVHKASLLRGVKANVATLLLENVNYMQGASVETFAESNQPGRGDGSTQRIINAVHNTVKNLEHPNFEYLSGELLGLRSTNDFSDQLTIAHDGDEFDDRHSDSSVASITIPKSAMEGGNRAYVAYWTTNKLFIPEQITYGRSTDHKTTYITSLSHAQKCSQTLTPSGRDPVLTGTVMGKETSDPQQLQAIITYNKKNSLHPLHGEYKVTWWNTDVMDWSRQKQCEMVHKTGLVEAHCYHLTDFTLLEDGMQNDPLVCNVALQTIAYILNILSIISLIVFIAFRTATFLAKIKRSNRSSTTQALIDRFVHRLDANEPILEDLMYTSFLLVFYIFFTCFKDQRAAHSSCEAMGGISYFLFLCIPFQIFVFAVGDVALRLNYRNVGKYASPLVALCVSVVLSFAITVGLGAGSDFFRRNDQFCWIRPTYVVPGIVLPLVFIFSTGIMSTVTVAWAIFDRRGGNNDLTSWQTKRERLLRIVRIVQMQLHLGLPWIFQFASLAFPYVTVWHFLFSFTNDSQGIIHLLIFFLFKRIENLRRDHEEDRPAVDPKQAFEQERFDQDLLAEYLSQAQENKKSPKVSVKRPLAALESQRVEEEEDLNVSDLVREAPRKRSAGTSGDVVQPQGAIEAIDASKDSDCAPECEKRTLVNEPTYEEIVDAPVQNHYDIPPADESYPDVLRRLEQSGYPKNPRMVEIVNATFESQDSQMEDDLREMEGMDDEEFEEIDEGTESSGDVDLEDVPTHRPAEPSNEHPGTLPSIVGDSGSELPEDASPTHLPNFPKNPTDQPDKDRAINFMAHENERSELNWLGRLGKKPQTSDTETDEEELRSNGPRVAPLHRPPSYEPPPPPPPPQEARKLPQITTEPPSDDESDSSVRRKWKDHLQKQENIDES